MSDKESTGGVEIISHKVMPEPLADLIDPDTSSFHDAEWRRWYEGLCHTDVDDSPESLREVLEDIVWAVLTIDLGPNGNVEQGVDEGIVQTESLLDAWEREIREIIEREPERTCRIEQISETEMRCSACGYLYEWTEVDNLEGGKLSYNGDYCKGCGAKVVDE